VAGSSDDEANEAAGQEASAINQALTKSGILANNPWMRMMSGVGGEKADKAAEDGGEEFGRPEAFTDTRELQRAQDEIDEESEAER